jgi:integrase/DNA-directed RNA polymerase subunit RPC12/RpoP
LICPKCGKEFQDDAIFCPYCGKKLVTTPKEIRTRQRGNGTGTAFKRGKTWTARVTVGWEYVDGHKVQKYRTQGGFLTKTDAENYCYTLKTNKRQQKRTDSFSQVYENWQKEYDGRITPTTMATYKAAWKYFKKLYPLAIEDITVSDLQDCINECPKGRSTLNDMRTVCSLVYKYAIINNLVTNNLAQHLYVNAKKKGTRPAFTKDELERIRLAVGKIPYADYVYFMCYTGFRPNEMLSLKKDAYDKAHNCLVGGFKTEAGTNRPVPVNAKIAPILAQRMASDSEYIFSRSDGTMMDDEHFRKYCFNPLMVSLGIKGKVPYSCRHTFANLLKNVSGSDTDKAALIGHSDASMTKYYQSADYESLKAIIDAM